jgi:hypothetical protein
VPEELVRAVDQMNVQLAFGRGSRSVVPTSAPHSHSARDAAPGKHCSMPPPLQTAMTFSSDIAPATFENNGTKNDQLRQLSALSWRWQAVSES